MEREREGYEGIGNWELMGLRGREREGDARELGIIGIEKWKARGGCEGIGNYWDWEMERQKGCEKIGNIWKCVVEIEKGM